MREEELEIRRRLWATHPCFGKYCDDGELQCGTFLPAIDFLRDDLLDIAKKIAKHSVEQVIEARKAGYLEGHNKGWNDRATTEEINDETAKRI